MATRLLIMHEKKKKDIALKGIKVVESDNEILCTKAKNDNVIRVEFDIHFHESIFIKPTI